MHVNAQTLSREQALQIAQQLYLKKILNDKGKEALIKRINEGNPNFDYGDLLYQGEKELTHASILRFCRLSFYHEFMFRSGFNYSKRQSKREQRSNKRAWKKYKDDTLAYEKWSDEHAEDLNSKLDKRLGKRYTIESSVSREDSIIINSRAQAMIMGKSVNYIDDSRSTWGATRTRTAKDFLDIGLIDSRIYEDVIKAIQDSAIQLEEDVCRFASERSDHYYFYPHNKSKQLAFLDTLENLGILSREQKELLIQSYQEFELKTPLEILSKSNHTLVLDASGYRDPFQFYCMVFEEIGSILPDFHFTDLKVSLDSVDEYGSVRYDMALSFKSDNTDYFSTFFYDYKIDSPVNSILPEELISMSEFYGVFNKWLSDRNSPDRLYKLEESNPKSLMGLSTRFGLVKLTHAQRMAWPEEYDEVLSHENHDNQFNRKGVSLAIQKFESIGLFSHLTGTQKSKAQEVVSKQIIYSYLDILRCFPDVVFIFDWETGNLENPYEENCMTFGKISRGSFTPTNVMDDFDVNFQNPRKKIVFSFDFMNKSYRRGLQSNGDWLDPEFFNLIKGSLRENNIDGDFYDCYDGGQVSGFIFLTDQQHQFIQSTFPNLLREL